jgi:hypothetical protein
MIRSVLLGTLFVWVGSCFAATGRPTLSGRVVDVTGKPLPHATVMVYHAGVKTGYSTFCPSCYVDCGKHVLTDSKGDFQIKDLAPELWFELLAVRDGYIPQFAKRVDPSKDTDLAITLVARPVVTDFSGVVRGRIVDSDGSPIADAIVNPLGLIVGKNSLYGIVDGLQPIAVTNKKGEFEISFAKATPKMLLSIEARAMAPKFVAMQTGTERHSVTLSEGAAITGRLVANGRPLGNAEIGLIAKDRGGFGDNLSVLGHPYDEVRIGTKRDGSFTITNVPEPVEWYLYAKMNSISRQGASKPVEVKTTRDNEYVRAVDLVIQPGYRLKGIVSLSDNKSIPDGMRITVASDRVRDSQTTVLSRDGHFEFANLPAGDYHVSPSVKGYRVKGTSNNPFDLPVTLDRDVDGFKVTVFPVDGGSLLN